MYVLKQNTTTNMVETSDSQDPPIKGTIALWEQKQKEHREKQLTNPFSEWEGASHRAKLSKNDEDYGKPVAGSKTEHRGQKANMLISSEVRQLLEVIYLHGKRDNKSKSRIFISFGKLFDLYTQISNKVVGLLLRARKYQLVDFEGEMLFQRRDEKISIYLEHAVFKRIAKTPGEGICVSLLDDLNAVTVLVVS